MLVWKCATVLCGGERYIQDSYYFHVLGSAFEGREEDDRPGYRWVTGSEMQIIPMTVAGMEIIGTLMMVLSAVEGVSRFEPAGTATVLTTR